MSTCSRRNYRLIPGVLVAWVERDRGCVRRNLGIGLFGHMLIFSINHGRS